MSAEPFDPVNSHKGTFDDYWDDKRMRAGYRLMGNQLRRDPAEQYYRLKAYESIGNQTMAAEQAAQRGGVSAFGMNNPSGIPAALMVRANMAAPYGEADLAARETGRQSTRATVRDYADLKQRHANWYATYENLQLAYEQMQIQEAIAKAQAAASAAAASGA